jgi:hypothetical protein
MSAEVIHTKAHSKNLNITLEDIAPCLLHNNTFIMTTITNYGYILYTLNMLKSLKPYGLDKSVFIVAMDERCAMILKKAGYHVFCVHEKSLGKFCPWNMKGYDKICYYKLELLYRILSLEKNVLLIDGDIVFLKNPIDDILQWSNETDDIWIQNDTTDDESRKNMCTGYMFIKTSKKMCELYDCVSEEGQKKYLKCAFDNNDQTYFNDFVKPECNMNALPLAKYPNGNVFYRVSEEIYDTIIMVHFNWLVGHLKMAKMKEHKMWLLTEDEESF